MTKSKYSKTLEVTWANGELVLDSLNANYSYGSLQRILKLGLKKIGFEKIKSIQNALILGVAGGSVIKTLVDEIGFQGKIIGVEIDNKVIALANQYFNLNKIDNLEIIIADAFDFVLKSNQKFDLIIIDIFQDNKMPDFLFEKQFATKISKMVAENGFVLLNTMNLIDNQNDKFINCFDKSAFSTKKLSKLERYNELVIVEKLNKGNL